MRTGVREQPLFLANVEPPFAWCLGLPGEFDDDLIRSLERRLIDVAVFDRPREDMAESRQ
jgi:hypothetical protein